MDLDQCNRVHVGPSDTSVIPETVDTTDPNGLSGPSLIALVAALVSSPSDAVLFLDGDKTVVLANDAEEPKHRHDDNLNGHFDTLCRSNQQAERHDGNVHDADGEEHLDDAGGDE